MECPPDGATAKAMVGATTPPQAFPSPQADECNLRGEVTEKFYASAECDLMTAPFCWVPAKMTPPSNFDSWFRYFL